MIIPPASTYPQCLLGISAIPLLTHTVSLFTQYLTKETIACTGNIIIVYLGSRRMLRISWTEKKPNVNVLREGNVQRSLLKTIRKRQMEFLGHVCRRRGLEFLSLTGKAEGKRDRGKQRITFLDSLCNVTRQQVGKVRV